MSEAKPPVYVSDQVREVERLHRDLLTDGVADQRGMPAGDVRDHRTVPRPVALHDPVGLTVELVSDRQASHGVREQITVEAFDLPDLIADVHGSLGSAHAPSVGWGRHVPSAVPSGLARTTL